MGRIKLLAVALTLGLPVVAQSQGGWYAGLDVGGATIDSKIEEHVFFGDTTDRSRETSTGIRLHGGYQFGRFFALELAYVDFGEIESHFDPDDCPNGAPGPCAFDTRTSLSGVLINLVGIVPLGTHWFLDGRLGIGQIKVKTHELAANGLDGSTKNDGFHYAIGGGYRFNDHWEILLDYSAYDQADFGLTLGGDFGVYNLGETTMTSLGINYRW